MQFRLPGKTKVQFKFGGGLRSLVIKDEKSISKEKGFEIEIIARGSRLNCLNRDGKVWSPFLGLNFTV